MSPLGKTNIPYLDRLWHPTTGCSMGCASCWARPLVQQRLAGTMKGLPQNDCPDRKTCNAAPGECVECGVWPYEDPFAPTVHPARLADPLHARKPQVMGVSFLGDLFDPGISDEQIWSVNNAAHGVQVSGIGHRLIFLTKQAARLATLGMSWPECCWMGVSVTCQRDADERIRHLLRTQAAHRWVSAEPLVGAVDLEPFFDPNGAWACGGDAPCSCEACAEVAQWPRDAEGDFVRLDLVIAGGESGPRARPCHPDWARSLRDQCAAAAVPFNWKQWGAHGPTAISMTSGIETHRLFDSFQQWVNKAATWCQRGDVLVDAAGRVCRCGGDLQEAVFPVAICGPGSDTGRLLDGQLHDALPWRIER